MLPSCGFGVCDWNKDCESVAGEFLGMLYVNVNEHVRR